MNRMPEKFIYKNTFEQVIEYVQNSYPYIDYRNLAITLLKNADENEIESLFRHINDILLLPEVVFNLKEVIKNLAHNNGEGDRKSTRLNSSHVSISYAVFCL